MGITDTDKQADVPCASDSGASDRAREAFTPGPWNIGVSCDHTPAVCVPVPAREGSGFVIAHINRIPRLAAFGGTAEANAKLIAAAPDIYAALKELLEVAELSECAPIEPGDECQAEVLCGHTDCNTIGCIIDKINRAQSAIAKATKDSTP